MKRAKPTTTAAPAHAARILAVKAAFSEAGVSVTEWARANNFSRHTVVDVLRGHRIGTRGEAHRVAVALGLKKGRVVDPALFNPAAAAQQTA